MASTLKDHEDICKERYKSILSSLARLENKSKENTKAIQGIEKQLQTGSASVKAIGYISGFLAMLWIFMKVFKIGS